MPNLSSLPDLYRRQVLKNSCGYEKGIGNNLADSVQGFCELSKDETPGLRRKAKLSAI